MENKSTRIQIDQCNIHYTKRNVPPVDKTNKCPKIKFSAVRFEVFTAVTMKNGVFWDITPCDSCKNRRFEET
jgi:hypothetical protein